MYREFPSMNFTPVKLCSFCMAFHTAISQKYPCW
jgi:hypothetical protein